MAERPIATGRAAELFEAGPGRVVRRYRNPAMSAEGEAVVMAHARAAGYPVPAVHDADGPALVMERVEGPTMLAELGRRPWTMRRHARTLADLHRRLHRIPGITGQPTPFGPGPSLLHLDLHPDNVLLSPDGPVVIDWTNAAAGPGAADVAMTWVIVATSVPPSRGLELAVSRAGQRLFARVFLAAAGEAEAVRACLPDVGAARRRDPNLRPEEDRAVARLVAEVAARP